MTAVPPNRMEDYEGLPEDWYQERLDSLGGIMVLEFSKSNGERFVTCCYGHHLWQNIRKYFSFEWETLTHTLYRFDEEGEELVKVSSETIQHSGIKLAR